MPTKPLHHVPAKPRGLEALSISPKELIELLEKERDRQAKRASVLKKKHQQKGIGTLQAALKRAREGKTVGRGRYKNEWIIELPMPPVFSPCDYDETIKRLKHDKREEIIISASEWSRFFPCDVELNGDG